MAVAFTQTDFRLRNDDGTQVTATWKAAANTNISVDVSGGDVAVRVRLCAQEVGTTAATFAANIFASKNAGAYAQVTAATANVKAVDSANLADNAATTQQVTAYTFVAGRVDDVDGTTTATASIVQNSGTEFEFMVQLVAADLANGDTLDFEVYRSGLAIATYAQIPRITIIKTGPVVVTTSFGGRVGRDYVQARRYWANYGKRSPRLRPAEPEVTQPRKTLGGEAPDIQHHAYAEQDDQEIMDLP